MKTILIAVLIKGHVVFVPAVCSQKRDIGGNQTVTTCERVDNK